jgi:hypothetical protein
MRWREGLERASLERRRLCVRHARRRRVSRAPGRWRAAFATLALISGLPATAQEVSAPALKAAFVYQLPKFTEWPTGAIAAGSSFSLCTIGDDSMAEAFERIMKGQDYGGHRIAVVRLAAGAPVQGCHVLYVAQGTPKAEAVLAEVRERPILTISDIEGFSKLGGITQLYFDGGQLRLYIDVAAATRAKLKFSSRLLSLSKKP